MQVAQLLRELGLLNESIEYLYDIGIIIGGTELQPVHFDIPEDNNDKIKYREAMKLPNAPACILLGVGKYTRLAVPTNLLPGITMGNPETLKNVGEATITNIRHKNGKVETRDQHVSILQSVTGFVFRGDFKHSGTPLIHSDLTEAKVWRTTYEIVKEHMMDKSKRNEKENMIAFDHLTEVTSLHSISRLHMVILPKDCEINMDSRYIQYDPWSDDDDNKND